MDKMYYVFLDPLQWEGLKELCEAYYRTGKAGSGFMQMAADKVKNARHFKETNIAWGRRYTEWETTTGTAINEPEWSFMWALRDIKSFEHNIRTLMAKYLGLRIKYDNVIRKLDQQQEMDLFKKAFQFEFTPASADLEMINAREAYKQQLPKEEDTDD